MNYVDFAAAAAAAAAAAETSSKCVLVSEEVALVTAENRVDKENERVIPAALLMACVSYRRAFDMQ